MNGEKKWMKVIKKEVHKLGASFDIVVAISKVPVGCRKLTGHLIFKANMGFTRKTRWVLDVHKHTSLTCLAHARVASI